jgi:hypothetical protein
MELADHTGIMFDDDCSSNTPRFASEQNWTAHAPRSDGHLASLDRKNGSQLPDKITDGTTPILFQIKTKASLPLLPTQVAVHRTLWAAFLGTQNLERGPNSDFHDQGHSQQRPRRSRDRNIRPP